MSGEVVYDFGGAELTSISAYRTNKYTRGQDADFNNLDILYRGDDGTAFNRFKTFTQELRLQGEAFNDRLDWLVGGYFADEKLRLRDNLSTGADADLYFTGLVAGEQPAAGAVPRLQLAQPLRAGLRRQPVGDQPGVRGGPGRGAAAGDQRHRQPSGQHPAQQPDHRRHFRPEEP